MVLIDEVRGYSGCITILLFSVNWLSVGIIDASCYVGSDESDRERMVVFHRCTFGICCTIATGDVRLRLFDQKGKPLKKIENRAFCKAGYVNNT